jgi:hypothetical protein
LILKEIRPFNPLLDNPFKKRSPIVSKNQRFYQFKNNLAALLRRACRSRSFGSALRLFLIKRSGPASQGLPQPILRIGVAVFFEERQGEALLD